METPMLRMPRHSRYAGQPADISSRRSIEIVAGHELSSASDPRASAIVDHFFHEDAYWRAKIPLDAVDLVFGQAFNFSKIKLKKVQGQLEPVVGPDGFPKRRIPFLNHVQSRFVLQPDHFIELHPPNGDISGQPVHRVNDFVYSVEAVGPVGVKFNLRDAIGGHLLSNHRFLSTQQMVFERVVVEGQYVTESPPLPLGAVEKRALLVHSILRSHQAGTQEPYYLYRVCRTNNCTSNPFRILDTVMNYRPVERLGAFLYRLPLNPRFYLRVRGLDSNPSVRKLVRAEFDEFVRDPETKKRKRVYVRQKRHAIRTARQAE